MSWSQKIAQGAHTLGVIGIIASVSFVSSGCCKKLGKVGASLSNTETTTEAVVDVRTMGPNGKPLQGTVRTGPGQNYGKVTSLENGTVVTILEKTKGDDGYWSHVKWTSHGGGEGWMHHDILSKTDDSDKPTPPPSSGNYKTLSENEFDPILGPRLKVGSVVSHQVFQARLAPPPTRYSRCTARTISTTASSWPTARDIRAWRWASRSTSPIVFRP
ncbi:MAG: SH3 domain-containing protein [Polyangiaceae bacterium]